MATVTASAESVTYSRPGMHVKENFEAVIATGLDEVYKRSLTEPMEGMQFFRTIAMNKATHKFQSHYGLGTISQNRDSEALPFDEKGLGFDWTLSVNTFRGGLQIERELQEDELYGVIGDLQTELVDSEKRSREYVLADVFNRCMGTSGAPFVCEDGMYLIDSARPNPFKQAGNWSNVESTGVINANGLYQTQLNFSAYTNERGQLRPLKLGKMIIRPTDEKTVWEILQSDKRPSDAMNAKNFQYGRFQYLVYNYLTSAVALFLAEDTKGPRNELMFGDRAAPQLETWTADNPDITKQRIRTRYGVGCGRPYIWRGQTVS